MPILWRGDAAEKVEQTPKKIATTLLSISNPESYNLDILG